MLFCILQHWLYLDHDNKHIPIHIKKSPRTNKQTRRAISQTSISAILTVLLWSHLPYKNNRHITNIRSTLMHIYNKFWIFCNPLTLSEGQGHSNWTQSFAQANVMVYLIKSHKWTSYLWILIMWNEFSISFNKPTASGSILNLIQFDY